MQVRATENPFLRKDPPFWSKTSWIQLGYGLWVNMAIFSIGLVFGFSAVLIPQLTSDVEMSLTLQEEAWITSVVTLSSPLGSLICGLILDKVGRRASMVISEVPMCIGWIYTGFAGSAMDIIIGRLISGVGVGMATGSPRAYTTEICLPNMRGVIGAFTNVAQSLGLTLQAGMGTVLDWKTTCYVCGGFSASLLILNMFLPESPYFLLMKHDDYEKAKIALMKFRAKSYDVNAEMEDLIDFKTMNDIRRLTFKESVKALFKETSCRPLSIMVPYVLIGQLAGVTVVTFWAVEMLKDSMTSVDPNTGNVLMATTRLCSGIATSMLLFKVGRRPMALTSSLGVGCICVTLGLFLILFQEYSIFPMFCFILYAIFATLGYYSLPTLIMFELCPLQVRGILGGIYLAFTNLSIFGCNQSFPYVRLLIGFPYTVLSFGIFSLLGTLFVYFFLPETKNLTLQEIEEYFRPRRPTTSEVLPSRRQSLTSVPSGRLLRPRSKQRQSKIDLQMRSKASLASLRDVWKNFTEKSDRSEIVRQSSDPHPPKTKKKEEDSNSKKRSE